MRNGRTRVSVTVAWVLMWAAGISAQGRADTELPAWNPFQSTESPQAPSGGAASPTAPTSASASVPVVPETGSVSGVLLERGTRKPLTDANVFLLPHKLKATTDGEGKFQFPAVPKGPGTWVVNLAGYQRLEQPFRWEETSGPVRLFVEKASYALYETTVVGKGERREDSKRSLKVAEILAIPGSGNDPIKAVQNLPGVNRAAPFSSAVIIQGSAPNDTRYLIDGHEVPIIFHFGGLTSVLPPESLDRVDYLSAGYGPEHGRANGGLVGVWTREPRDDRLHGMGFVDAFSAGAAVEGRAGKESRFFLAARQSYVGAVLKAVLPSDRSLNLTVAPTYSDFTGMLVSRLSPRDEFKLLTVGSLDTLEFLLSQPVGQDPSLRGEFFSQTAFLRLIPQLTHRHSERTVSRWSLGMGRDWVRVNAADNFFFLRTLSMTARGEVERRMSSGWMAQWGFDHRYNSAEVDLKIRQGYSAGGVANPFSTGSLRQVTVTGKANYLGLYWRNELTPSEESPWTFLPSLRAEYYSTTRQLLPLPRAGVRYRWDDGLSFRLSAGSYAQPPREQDTDPTTGNPDIQAPRAYHLAFSAERDLRQGSSRGWVLTPGVFYKYLEKLVVNSTGTVTRNGETVAENVTNAGTGRAYGFELLARLDASPWTGWLSYTLSRSTRTVPGQQESVYGFDQTHVLTAIASRELPSNWRVGARLRYATGNPYTPVSGGILDADNDVYVPQRGEFYSERLPGFFQLDLRVDKKWIYDTWMLTAYLDIQNATNRENLERIQYAYDYSSSERVAGLPIIPSIGLRAEF